MHQQLTQTLKRHKPPTEIEDLVLDSIRRDSQVKEADIIQNVGSRRGIEDTQRTLRELIKTGRVIEGGDKSLSIAA